MKTPIFALFALLKKKLILVAGLSNLPEQEFFENVQAKINGAEANPGIVTLDPLPSAVQTKIDEVKAMCTSRIDKEEELKLLTTEINAGKKWLNDTIVDKWMPDTQTAIADDETKARAMCYTWRGEHDPVPPEISVLNSHPVVLEVINSGNLMHDIHVVNNVSESWKIPEDADSCLLYETFDQANTDFLKKMIFLGVMKKGKFVNHFEPEDRGKDVWYVAVYIAKNSGASGELSGAIKGTVV